MNATSCPPDACIQHHSTAGSAQKRWAKFILMTMPVPSPSTCASASDLGSDAIFAIYCKSLHRCTLHEGHWDFRAQDFGGFHWQEKLRDPFTIRRFAATPTELPSAPRLFTCLIFPWFPICLCHNVWHLVGTAPFWDRLPSWSLEVGGAAGEDVDIKPSSWEPWKQSSAKAQGPSRSPSRSPKVYSLVGGSPVPLPWFGVLSPSSPKDLRWHQRLEIVQWSLRWSDPSTKFLRAGKGWKQPAAQTILWRTKRQDAWRRTRRTRKERFKLSMEIMEARGRFCRDHLEQRYSPWHSNRVGLQKFVHRRARGLSRPTDCLRHAFCRGNSLEDQPLRLQSIPLFGWLGVAYFGSLRDVLCGVGCRYDFGRRGQPDRQLQQRLPLVARHEDCPPGQGDSGGQGAGVSSCFKIFI